MLTSDEPRTLSERYISASGTSDLTIATAEHVRSSGEVILAAGAALVRRTAENLRQHQSRTADLRLGELLLRLRSEWDGTPKLPDLNFSERLRLINALRSLGPVKEAAAAWLTAKGYPVSVAAGVIYHWLDPVCHRCHGQRWLAVPGTGRLSAQACPLCNGTGERIMNGARAYELSQHLSRAAGEFPAAVARKTR